MNRTAPFIVLSALLASGPSYGQVQDLDEGLPAAPGNPSIEAQVQGNFPKEKRDKVPAGSIQEGWAAAGEEAGIRYNQPYFPDKRYDLILRERMTTTVAIPEWDNIEEVILSDDVHFKFKRARKEWIVHVWPTVAGADGNLTLIGASGYVYVFKLVGHNPKSKALPDIYFSMSAPKPRIDGGLGGEGIKSPELLRQASKVDDWLFDIPYDPTKMRYDLTMTGDEGLAPERVYRDEYRVFLDYGAKADATQGVGIWKVQDKIDQPVNWKQSPDRRMVVVYWAGPLTLRNGSRTVCIKPK